MKVKFAKSLLVVGLFAGTAMEAHAVTGGEVVQIGCTVPAAGFNGATVYSVDKGTTTVVGHYTAVSAGTVCTKAINALTNGGSAASYTTPYFQLIANTNIVIPGTGYSLQQFTLQDSEQTPTAVNYALVGCTAPAATGGTVYSVDAKGGTGTTTLIAANTSIAQGVNCAGALNDLSSWKLAQATTVLGTSTTVVGAYALQPSSNVVVSTTGYSLQQFLLQ